MIEVTFPRPVPPRERPDAPTLGRRLLVEAALLHEAVRECVPYRDMGIDEITLGDLASYELASDEVLDRAMGVYRALADLMALEGAQTRAVDEADAGMAVERAVDILEIASRCHCDAQGPDPEPLWDDADALLGSLAALLAQDFTDDGIARAYGACVAGDGRGGTDR